MRIIVLFDLPVETAEDRSEYGKFRRSLIKSGFLMMQESIYCKLAVNSTITEKQYSKIEFVVGESESETIDSDETLVIL